MRFIFLFLLTTGYAFAEGYLTCDVNYSFEDPSGIISIYGQPHSMRVPLPSDKNGKIKPHTKVNLLFNNADFEINAELIANFQIDSQIKSQKNGLSQLIVLVNFLGRDLSSESRSLLMPLYSNVYFEIFKGKFSKQMGKSLEPQPAHAVEFEPNRAEIQCKFQ